MKGEVQRFDGNLPRARRATAAWLCRMPKRAAGRVVEDADWRDEAWPTFRTLAGGRKQQQWRSVDSFTTLTTGRPKYYCSCAPAEGSSALPRAPWTASKLRPSSARFDFHRFAILITLFNAYRDRPLISRPSSRPFTACTRHMSL